MLFAYIFVSHLVSELCLFVFVRHYVSELCLSVFVRYLLLIIHVIISHLVSQCYFVYILLVT